MFDKDSLEYKYSYNELERVLNRLEKLDWRTYLIAQESAAALLDASPTDLLPLKVYTTEEDVENIDGVVFTHVDSLDGFGKTHYLGHPVTDLPTTFIDILNNDGDPQVALKVLVDYYVGNNFSWGDLVELAIERGIKMGVIEDYMEDALTDMEY